MSTDVREPPSSEESMVSNVPERQRDTGVPPVRGTPEVGEAKFLDLPHTEHGRDARVTLNAIGFVGSASADATAPQFDRL
jgi:hypothetical protein